MSSGLNCFSFPLGVCQLNAESIVLNYVKLKIYGEATKTAGASHLETNVNKSFS